MDYYSEFEDLMDSINILQYEEGNIYPQLEDIAEDAWESYSIGVISEEEYEEIMSALTDLGYVDV